MKEWAQQWAVLLFGMASWMPINVIYIELPILCNIVPESWNLASYIVVLIQISCVSPLIYSLVRQKLPKLVEKLERKLVIGMMLLAGVGIFLASRFYTWRMTVLGTQRSVPLLLAILLLSIPCTTSDVLYLPIAGRLSSKGSFITSFFIGMGLGAFIPSLLALAQGSPTVTKVFDDITNTTEYEVDANFSFSTFSYITILLLFISFGSYLVIAKHLGEVGNEKDGGSVQQENKATKSVSELWALLMVSFVAGALQNAILPGILAYATSSYGSDLYHMCAVLFVMTNPLFCLLQHAYSFSSTLFLVLLSLLSAAPSLFILVLALLQNTISWSGIPLLLQISSGASAGLLSLLRTAVAARIQESSAAPSHDLFLCGAATQGGSCFGAIIVFVAANVFHVFRGS